LWSPTQPQGQASRLSLCAKQLEVRLFWDATLTKLPDGQRRELQEMSIQRACVGLN
jgi:hypothetical protein